MEAEDVGLRLDQLETVTDWSVYLLQRESPALQGVNETRSVSFAHQNASRSGDGRESRQRRDVFDRSARLHTHSRRPARPHVGTIGQSRDSVAGPRQVSPAVGGRRIPTQNNQVLSNLSWDRDNGGVALPAPRRCANPRVPNQPPAVRGGGKPRRRRATPGCLRELRSRSVHGGEDVTSSVDDLLAGG